MATNQPRQGSIADLISGLLDRGYTKAAQPVLEAIASSTNTGIVGQRLDELDTEARRLAEAGQRLTSDNPILRATLADLTDTLRADSLLINNASSRLEASAISASANIQRQLALPGMTDAQLSRLGITWNSPDPAAVAQLVDYSQSAAWQDTIATYAADIVDIVNNQAIRGISLGWSPYRTAAEIRRITEALPAHQANNLMRTMQLTSYRDSTAIHQTANRDLASQIVRIAALDRRTCLSCVAQHGTIIWDSENDTGAVPRVEDHHSGRCTSVMVVKGRPRNIQTGEDWFNSLPPERQAEQDSFVRSPGKLEAFRAGKVTLRDFSQPYTDPVFGEMLREASLTHALKS